MGEWSGNLHDHFEGGSIYILGEDFLCFLEKVWKNNTVIQKNKVELGLITGNDWQLWLIEVVITKKAIKKFLWFIALMAVGGMEAPDSYNSIG